MSPEKMKYIRKQLGDSQAQLAERLEVAGRQTISNYETGARKIPGPAAKLLRIIAAQEGVDMTGFEGEESE